MGALHEGHIRLIQRAASPRLWGTPTVLVSIFVNPLQFGPGEDLDRYPRRLQADGDLAVAAGADAIFAPSPRDIYPRGDQEITRVLPPASLLSSLCALHRPGHFEGVATVVARLLAMVRPERLFLGEKDWQQLVILRRMVADLGWPVSLEGMATVREADGLALSSRNAYLTPEERRQARGLPAALAACAAGAVDGQAAETLLRDLEQRLEQHALRTEYVALVHPTTLSPLDRLEGLALLAAAVRCGSTRLIDHVFLMRRAPIIAIDGPAGAGKSTVSRALAQRLGLTYLDTGAMYRALTWWVLRQGINPAEPLAVAPLLEGLDLDLRADQQGQPRILINGHDVTSAIRDPEVTAVVSTVASHPCVRESLTTLQRRLGERGGLVAEGRDIGTAVFPEAECKIFLTASTAERARRRARDLRQRGYTAPALDELVQQIAARDAMDSSREVAPLRQAPDAVELVTDGMDIGAVIDAMEEAFRAKVAEEAWPAAGRDPFPAGSDGGVLS